MRFMEIEALAAIRQAQLALAEVRTLATCHGMSHMALCPTCFARESRACLADARRPAAFLPCGTAMLICRCSHAMPCRRSHAMTAHAISSHAVPCHAIGMLIKSCPCHGHATPCRAMPCPCSNPHAHDIPLPQPYTCRLCKPSHETSCSFPMPQVLSMQCCNPSRQVFCGMGRVMTSYVMCRKHPGGLSSCT